MKSSARQRPFRHVFAALAVLVALATSTARAQQFLYGALPPKDAAYLRVVSALPDPVRVQTGAAGAMELGSGTADRIGAYHVVTRENAQKLSIVAVSGAVRGEVTMALRPASFTTVLLLPGSAGIRAVAIDDDAQFNQLRAKLTFYNAAPDCASAGLAVQPDGPAVFENVAVAAGRMRAVNPISVPVQAQCGTMPLPGFDLSGLEAGGRYSIWLMGERTHFAFLSTDSVTPWKP